MSNEFIVTTRPNITIIDEAHAKIPLWQLFKTKPQYKLFIVENVIINDLCNAVIVIGKHGQKFKIKTKYFNKEEPEQDLKIDETRNALFITQDQFTFTFTAITCNIQVPKEKIEKATPSSYFSKDFSLVSIDVLPEKNNTILLQFYGHFFKAKRTGDYYLI